MVRPVMLGVALLTAVAAPAQAWVHGGGHGGRAFHSHHGGFRHHGGHVFAGVGIVAPWPWWYDYPYYPYPYGYPAAYPPVVVEPSPPVEPIQREVVYPGGKYVLYGDGISQPWQWVWIPASPPPPPPAP